MGCLLKIMPKIYKRNCDTCGEYYERQGKSFCSKKCRPQPIKFLKSKRFGGMKHTKETLRKKSFVQLGERGSNWKGGISRCNANNFKSNDASRRQANLYQNNRKKIDIQFRLACNLRARINTAIVRGYKSGSAIRDLGCTIQELKFYIEGQFKDGMTWNNWSRDGWHIDHKIPLAFFDLTDRDQFLQAVHYTNLQPMWAIENIKKSKKIITV